MNDAGAPLVSVRWRDRGLDGIPELLDQTVLPQTVVYREMPDLATLRQAIIDLVVRGAPAIGIAAAYGLARHCLVAAARLPEASPGEALEPAVAAAIASLGDARPTAVNLRWALTHLRTCFDHHVGLLTARESAARLLLEAKRIHAEDAQCCRQIARHGAALLPRTAGILTICNTGALATGGIGTALGCIRQAHQDGATGTIFACETRPLLQGARLTVFECQRLGLPVALCTDGMAGCLMAQGRVGAVIAGADRIAANGDTANKIGTYQLAVLARHHGLPCYIAAPYSTFDRSLPDGGAITLEERPADEVRGYRGVPAAPADCPVVNPAFDVTPASLITALITERGVIRPPTPAAIAELLADDHPQIPAV
jgi:methylthioribose-1-phosphate isomerase